MKVLKTTEKINTMYDYGYDTKYEEVLVDELETKYFTEHEIELLKKWEILWSKAWDEDVETCDYEALLEQKFTNDKDLDYVKLFDEVVHGLYEYYDPKDVEILEKTIRINKRILKNLEIKKIKDERYNLEITEIVLEKLNN